VNDRFAGGDDPLAALRDRRGAMWRTYPAVEARVLFIQVNKNACTSLKWMMAQLAGEDLSAFGPSLGAATSDEDDIHDRRQWHRSPRLDRIDAELRSQMHPDNGWFVFAVTRDPRARLFSAWQSKLLLDNPGYAGRRHDSWYPRHPVSTESIVTDFAAFVDLLAHDPDHQLRADPHFADQVELLHEDLVTYTDIYDVRDLGRLQRDLRRHLDQVGWTGDLTLPRANDTPLRATSQVFDDGVREQIEKVYSADFDRFGDRWDFGAFDEVPAWTEAQLEDVERRAALGRRIGYLRSQALRYRDEARREHDVAQRQRARIRRLRRRLRSARAKSAPPARRPAARPSVSSSPLRAGLGRLTRGAREWLRRR
jgi:hypothetical protein